MRAFPKDLAKVVMKRWDQIVAGDYKPPFCPDFEALRELLEVAVLAAGASEEGRFPKFNLVATNAAEASPDNNWPLACARKFDVAEIRRFAPVASMEIAAIWVRWNQNAWEVAGLVELDRNICDAKIGLSYEYRIPSHLFIEVTSPGRIKVYQGEYYVASLVHGHLDGTEGFSFHLALHGPINAFLRRIERRLNRPPPEEAKETADFEFLVSPV